MSLNSTTLEPVLSLSDWLVLNDNLFIKIQAKFSAYKIILNEDRLELLLSTNLVAYIVPSISNSHSSRNLAEP